LEKEIGTSLYLRGFCVAGSIALGEEAAIFTEDGVDDVFRVLEILSPQLVTLVVILLVLSLSGLGKRWSIE
jgi:hypothetical protein